MPKSYAIVPAAGRSRRMGAPKLLLPWPTADRPDGLLIDHVLDAWQASVVDRVVAVIRCDDKPLLDACHKWDIDVIAPTEPPPDMTSSIRAGLQHVATVYRPGLYDGCFIAPSDLPSLKTQVIDGLWKAALVQWPATEILPQCVWTPTFAGQSGHPALLPWPACAGIFDLPVGAGVDSHVRSLTRHTVSFPINWANQDCDTPDAYQQALDRAKRVE